MTSNEQPIHARWIHLEKPDLASVNGVLYLPQCTCSNCEKQVSFEKPVCPYCGAIMDGKE